MRYATLPGIHLEASRVCLGTGGFGSSHSRDDSFKLLDAFAAAGGNFLDTAHVYAAWLPNGAGASERTLGAWLKSRNVRKKFIVGTKGAHPDLNTMHIPRMTRADISRDLQESMDRLETDHVELYWLHRDAPDVPVGEILGILNELLAAKRISAIGNSNWSPQRQSAAAAYARENKLTGFCASQIGFSLAEADPATASGGMLFMDDETLRFHRQSGTPLVAYSSQANGFFSGKYTREMPRDKGVLRAHGSEKNFDRLERVRTLAEKHRRSTNEIAVAYVTSQSFQSYAIAGSRTVEQVADSCRAADLQLTAEEVKFLEAGL